MKQLLTTLTAFLLTLSTFAQGNMTIGSGTSLKVYEKASLIVLGTFNNDPNGTVTLNSTEDDFSSLIVQGEATGDVIYNRYVNAINATGGGGWDGTGSPVSMTIASFISDNSDVLVTNNNLYSLGPYNNATDLFEYYESGTSDSYIAGKGYAMATQNGAIVKYTGSIATTDQSINVINNDAANGGVGTMFNMVSNPYPSYINGTTFLSENNTVFNPSYTAVYGWNGFGYDIYNNFSEGFYIAPGQGFKIAANNTTETALNFTTAMRTTAGSGDFVLGLQPLIYSLELKLFNEQTQSGNTNFYFKNGLTLDLDPGYDAAAYNQSTKLSTRLPQGSQEFAFAINAMGIDALQNARVPLEIRQNAGQAFWVIISDMELPEDIYVYLEDTLNGTLTSLKDGDFELVAQSNLSGAERFFIVFNENSILSSGDTLGMSALNVYKVNKDNFVTIAGISPELGQIDVSLYNILGITVLEKALNPTTATQRVSTDGLASGLYVVQLRSENQVFNKKIIVE
jgi:hypothetical protein